MQAPTQRAGATGDSMQVAAVPRILRSTEGLASGSGDGILGMHVPRLWSSTARPGPWQQCSWRRECKGSCRRGPWTAVCMVVALSGEHGSPGQQPVAAPDAAAGEQMSLPGSAQATQRKHCTWGARPSCAACGVQFRVTGGNRVKRWSR